jgi:adenosylcobinamide kinase/adenosylcobinamide-phosphate guanylyltransferase
MPLVFITGPVRSGKSRFAERLARERGRDVTYVATGYNDPDDREWAARIAHHRARRPADWHVVETAAPGAPSLEAIVCAANADQTLIVDSTGTWLAERMRARLEGLEASAAPTFAAPEASPLTGAASEESPPGAAAREESALDEAELEAELFGVTRALVDARAYVIVVGDETGWGIVPEYPSGRVFRDVLGRAQQRLAATAQRAYVVIAGVALDLHALGRPV